MHPFLRTCFFVFAWCVVSTLKAQTYYFPPAGNSVWDTVTPSSIGWCQPKIDTLIKYLELKNSKSFVVLHKGKIAIEHYFGSYTKDSIWYWASAGKSLAAMLTGIAQVEGHLSIQDTSSKYLGLGWTNAPPDKEALIKVVHQLSMSTGLDYNVADLDCKDDTCLNYKADAGTQWYYHNAPYLLVHNVIENATGLTMNQFTRTRIGNKIGFSNTALWYDGTFYSKAREMARFGLLTLNKGVWNEDTILKDAVYYNAMVNTSQQMNKSYGYLWWLNGKGSAMIPGTPLVFNRDLVPNGPGDMFAALGKNDQKIYVVPSLDVVVVRQGNAAETSQAAITVFDDNLWILLMDVINGCPSSVMDFDSYSTWSIYPNPAQGKLFVSSYVTLDATYTILSIDGKQVKQFKTTSADISELSRGIYFVHRYVNGRVEGVKRLVID